jgi:uncharacterized membrane protein YjjP (DUF1212 family)
MPEYGETMVTSDPVAALRLAVDAGVIMLRCGGEVGRVEDTVGYLARAFGARTVDAYATPTGLIVTGEGEDGTAYTVVRRVTFTRNELAVVEAINDLSRQAAGGLIGLSEAGARLSKIATSQPPYGRAIILGAAVVASAAAAFLFGGSSQDMLGAGFAGLAVQQTSLVIEARGWGTFAQAFAGGVMAAGMAKLLHMLIPTVSKHFTVVGAIMTLVPGVAITNALRDIMGGQLVSGVSRSAEALAIAVSVAAGVGLVLGTAGH